MVSNKDIKDIKRRAGIVTEQSGMMTITKTHALAYRELVDGLYDMIKSKRLKQGDIPDDYEWLMNQLEIIEQLDPSYKR